MKKKRNIACLGGGALLITLYFIFCALFPVNSGTLRVSFLDVGEGRAILVQGPSGVNVLIDGGANMATMRAIASILGPLQRTISIVIETNSNASNAGGIVNVLNRYHVGALITAKVPNNSISSRLIANVAGELPHLLHKQVERGARIYIGGGAYIEVLMPDRDVSKVDTATGSLVLKIVYGTTTFLLPSDVSTGVEYWLTTLDTSTTLDSDVLSVGHFGAPNVVDKEWLSAVRPQFVVISVGKNSYGYPFITTLSKLSDAGVKVLTTATSTITFISDGVSVREQ